MHDLIGLNMNQLKLKLVGNYFSPVIFFFQRKQEQYDNPNEKNLNCSVPLLFKNENVVILQGWRI